MATPADLVDQAIKSRNVLINALEDVAFFILLTSLPDWKSIRVQYKKALRRTHAQLYAAPDIQSALTFLRLLSW